MRNILFGFLIALAFLSTPVVYGLTLITMRNPFADINKLGTVIKPGEKITIQNTNGTVTIEYSAPTKRWIIWNGESREIKLYKSSLLNGIYKDRALFKKGPIGDIYGVDYCESTATFKNEKDMEEFISNYDADPNMTNCVKKQTRFNFAIGKKGSKKYFFIQVIKYKLMN